MPVENQYLESFSLADSWQRITQLPVRVWLNKDIELSESLSDETGVIHAIKDPEGIPVGSMYIPYPSKEELEDSDFKSIC